jgi:hypothetical protein
MDRSFLSDPKVVAASRAFVCIRLATYENADEARFLEEIFRGRSGELENTVFSILAPDGKALVRSGRSPHMTFRGLDEAAAIDAMAKEMTRLAARYEPKEGALDHRPLPACADLRRGLNIAACDLLPLVVVADPSLESALAKLAWSDAFRGRFAYARADATAKVAGVKAGDGLSVVAPDAYGVTAKMLASGRDAGGIEAALG